MESLYRAVYANWKRDPAGFWMAQAGDIDWIEAPRIAFDKTAGIYGRWFPDGVCNTCHNALDRHVANNRGAQAALIHDSPVTGTRRRITYGELLDEVTALAATLQDLGVGKGDRVIVYMPMIPETAAAMLACARLGAIHSVVFGGFAARELATRIDDARPKLVLTASCGIEPARIVAYKPLLDRAIELAVHKPEATLVLQRPELEADMTPGRDHDWAALRMTARGEVAAGRQVPCVPLLATDPLYILYTSGTTGQPKGVVRDQGGHMVALHWSMQSVFGAKAGEVFWAASDVGWVVGHSYIVYGPLLKGCTAVLFEGKPVGTPDAGTFWRIVAEHGVMALFTAPTAVRAIRKEDPDGLLASRYDLSKFRTLFLAGERADTETILWAERALKVPVIDHWWQTETGWPIAANPAGLGLLPVKYGSPGVPMPGYDVQILDEAGRALPAGEMGAVSIRLPLPPGALPTLWNADERFRAAYLSAYPGYYSTSDAGLLDEDGYIVVMGRTDDVINVAGHRLSTGEMEEAVSAHPAVAECAVVGLRDAVKGELPCGFVVLKNASRRSAAAIEAEIVDLVRERIGPVAAFRRVVVVERLPKTRSGKILRATIKKIADRDEWEMPATIEDAGALDDIERALATGLGLETQAGMTPEHLSAAAARRIALAAQGFAEPRSTAAPDWQRMAKVLGRLHLLQIDSVSVSARAHYMPLFSRLGSYPREALETAAWGQPRRLFEYWAHEASLLPLDLQPLLRWRMARAEAGLGIYGGLARFSRDERGRVEAVFARIEAEGALAASDFEAPRGAGGWWGWSDTKRALEYLFWAGRITTGTRRAFQRVYDIPERVLPAAILAAPTPSPEDAHRALLRLSARALGIATAGDLRDYFRLSPEDVRPRLAELVEAGALLPVTVEGWEKPAFLDPAARRPRKIEARALLSPFDPLVFERARTERLFGFRYRIEIYTPAEKRVYGYYVLPFLFGERLVGRVDLKADRAAGVLRVLSAHAEPHAPLGTAAALLAELGAMAGWLGLSGVSVVPAGDFGPILAGEAGSGAVRP